jgi:hypothetical protein
VPQIIGEPTAAAAETLALDRWWLVDPDGPTTLQLRLVGESLDSSRSEGQAVYQPLGRTVPMVVADTVTSEVFQLELDFDSQADYDTFEALRGLGRPLLLKSDMTDQWWIRLGPDRPSRLLFVGGRTSTPRRRVAITATGVDEPAES